MSNEFGNNGFADALKNINTVIKIDKNVELDALEEAANFFANELKKIIPRGIGTVHLQDELKVVVKNDMVQVVFSDKAWYWSLADKGHKKAGKKGRVKGLHFTRIAIDTHAQKLADRIAGKIQKIMEG